MQVETCQVRRSLRLGDNTRIVIHRRQGPRVGLGATTPTSTQLILDGAAIRPMPGSSGSWNYLFSLYEIHRFTLGRSEVRVWLRGKLISLAADYEDSLHIGLVAWPPVAARAMARLASTEVALPAPAALAPPQFRIAGECRPLRRSA